MNCKKMVFDKEMKQQAVALSYEIGNIGEIANKLGIDRTLFCRWQKEFKDTEFDYFSDSYNLNIADLKRENINLQYLIKSAKMENDKLTKAISTLRER